MTTLAGLEGVGGGGGGGGGGRAFVFSEKPFLVFFFVFFFSENKFDISYRLSRMKTICIICQVLFSDWR